MSQWPNLFGEGASRGERPAGHVWFKGEFRKADDPELRGWVQSMEDMENFEALYSVFRELLELEKGERMRTMVTNRLLVRERMQSDRKLQQEILLSRTEVPPVAPSGPVGLVEKLARGAGRAARAKADLSVKAYGSIRKAGLAAGGVGKNGDVAYEDRLEAACQRMFGETSDGDEDDEDDDDEEEEARGAAVARAADGRARGSVAQGFEHGDRRGGERDAPPVCRGEGARRGPRRAPLRRSSRKTVTETVGFRLNLHSVHSRFHGRLGRLGFGFEPGHGRHNAPAN